MLSENSRPFVSVVMPARNEADFVAACLDSLLAMRYPPERLEILVIDGASEDGTARIVGEYAARDPRIRLIENPERITPVALNRGIAAAKGEVVLRADAHAHYPPEYLATLVAALGEYGVDMAGSVMITKPREQTMIGRAIVQALSSPFGVGNSYFRTGSSKPRVVDTLFGGAYRRSTLDRVGPFNERLARSQDVELNLRIKKLGGRVLLVPSVSCEYFARSDLRSFLIHNFQNGIWVILPFLYSPIMPVTWKHLVPLVFVLGIVFGIGLTIAVPSVGGPALIAYLALYLAVSLVASIRIAMKQRELAMAILMPMIFFGLHVPYGIGSLVAGVRVVRARARATPTTSP